MATHIRPLNVFVATPDSLAEKKMRSRADLPGSESASPEAIAGGLHPTPAHDLHFHGGKTVQHLNFTNFYVGDTDSWRQNDIEFIDKALAAAMSDPHLNNVIMQYFKNEPITSTFTPSQVLPGSAP